MHAELKAHPDYFRKEIIQLADNVYMAFGFAASNVFMIVGDDSLIIIDTTETTAAAANILAEFRKISDLPVKSIILTHSHRDHVSGATVFAEDNAPEVITSDKGSEDPLIEETPHPRAKQAMLARTKRQFGIGLSYPDEIIGIGVGPGDRPLQGMGAGMMAPTRLISDAHTSITLAGIGLELVMAPGETPDHMVVWYPEKKILFSGDHFYRSFPNLYAIRGTAYRDFDGWADTMDLLMGFNPEVLGPGHTKPLFGAEVIRGALTDYRDAIRHVVDRTREGMDAGMTIDELAHNVTLPPELADKSHLREYYGRVAYAVRAYAVGTMGWFDGNPTSLDPLSPQDEARRMIRLAGGADSVWQEVEAARKAGEHQWALQLLDRLINAGDTVDGNDPGRARAAKAAVLRDHAVSQINCPTRHYYIQSAKELEQQAGDGDA